MASSETITCTYCENEIVGLRVKCCECIDFEMCLQCFAAGAKIGPHENTHSYQFVHPGPIEIFKDKTGWSVQEDIQLLNAIERYGFGNWDDISKQLKTRTADEVRDEYISRFLVGTIGRLTWAQAEKQRPRLNGGGATSTQVTTTAVDTAGSQGGGGGGQPPSLHFSADEASQFVFTSLNDELEMEYDNGAEVLISSLKDSSMEDDELDTALKLAHVDMYTIKLRERARRKRVSRDYQLVAQFFSTKKDKLKKRGLREERELEERLRSLSQFHTAAEHEQVVASAVRFKELSRRLTELINYREAGITRIDELPHYEQARLAHHSRSGSRTWISVLRHSHIFRRREKEDEDAPHSVCTTKSSCKGTLVSATDSGAAGGAVGVAGAVGGANPHHNSHCQIDLIASRHLLSPTETQMCTSLELTPSQFISMKGMMLLDPIDKLESNTEKVIMDHVSNNNWIAK
ncbi:transcriptional adapter 2B-like [Nilaparvata lugens]|uniref:transcriptional adapter 2B-like n=1 Tax=Nilaparvata lugens TaxID=108931 RepID=UPI00193DDA69|nr:transcriptional adapter 2B-like [Nilaparvata lugens]